MGESWVVVKKQIIELSVELEREKIVILVGSIHDATNQEIEQRLAEARKNGSGTYTSPGRLLNAHDC
jgi:hypothetical protein